MNKKVIPIQIRNEQVIGAGVVVGAEGSGNDVILQPHFGQSWEGLVKYVTFRDALGENPTVVLLTTDMLVEAQEPQTGTNDETEGTCPVVCSCASVYNVTIPFSAKAEEGKMMATFQGYALNEDGSQVEAATMTATAYFRVLPSDYSTPEDGSITPDLATQIQTEIENLFKKHNLDISRIDEFLADPTFSKLKVAGAQRELTIDNYGLLVRDKEGNSLLDIWFGDRQIVSGLLRLIKGEDGLGGQVQLVDGSSMSRICTVYNTATKRREIVFDSLDDQKGTTEPFAIRAMGAKVEQLSDLTTKEYVDRKDTEAVGNAVLARSQAVEAAADAAKAAAAAQSIANHPNKAQDGTWWVWDATDRKYVNTGAPAKGEKGDPGDSIKGDKGDPAPAPLIGPASMISELEPGQRLLITSGEAGDQDWSGVLDPMTEIAKLRAELDAMKAGVIELNVKVGDWTGSEAPYYASLKGTGLGERYGIVGLSETATQAQREAAAEAQINLVRRSDGTRVLEASWTKPEMDLPITIILV